MFPLAKVKEETGMTPRRMGALLGHSCAMAVWTMEWFGVEFAKAETEAQNRAEEPELKIEDVPEKLRFDKWYEAMRRVANPPAFLGRPGFP